MSDCVAFLEYFLDLLIDMLAVLASYSITVKELKFLFSLLQVKNNRWVSKMIIIM